MRKLDGNGWAEKITCPEIEMLIVGNTDGAMMDPDHPTHDQKKKK
jgi:hypothetical protein